MSGDRRWEAILFDFDGVLVDSEPIHFECWREVLIPYGIELEWPVYHKSFIGVSDRTMLDVLSQVARKPVTAAELYELYPVKKALFRERVMAAPPLSAGIEELLGALEGYRLGLVTSSGRAEVQPVIAACGLERFFQAAVYGDDVKDHKPAPEPYRKAAAMLKVNRALVVEDSEAGVASGRAAGFDVLRIPDPHRTARLVKAELGLHPPADPPAHAGG